MPGEPAVVLCFSGHDPAGGAGLQADVEAIAAAGGHALGVITAHTVQDTINVATVTAPPMKLFREQIESLLADCRIQAIKIGLLGEAAQVPAIAGVIRRAAAPVVLDPVLRAGGGTELVTATLMKAMMRELLPLADVITPNAAEARRMAPGAPDLDACATVLLDAGARNVLVTGGDERGETVTNSWLTYGQPPRRFQWPRLPGPFHGAGCTLASAIAVRLAQRKTVAVALEEAQAYTHATLERAIAIGHGRKLPGRLAT